MHYLNESAFKAYKDGGCEEVEIYAAKDERTCEICGTRHEKKYKIDKRPILPFHPNCRCTYLPVIDLKNKAEELVVVNSEELSKNSKFFRPVEFDGTKNVIRNGNYVCMRHCTTTVNDVYVSTGCELDAKGLHKIDTLITQSLKKMKINKRDNLPTIYVMNSFEIVKDMVASYNPINNILIVSENFAKDIEAIKLIQKDGACIDNELSTIVHELFHWVDAQEYIKYFGAIKTQEQYDYYWDYMNKKRKKLIEKIGINEYNVTKISEYAKNSIDKTDVNERDYDEVYTEYRVLKLLGEVLL